MKIASAQYPIACHASLEEWKIYMEQWIQKAASQQAGILVFPEYGAMELVSIFQVEIQQDLHKQLQELQTIYPETCSFYEAMAARYQVIIIAPSFPVREGDFFYNRVNVFSPKGYCGYQDKFFMTRFENEIWRIHPAPKVLTLFQAGDINFGIQICYDVEFAIGAKLLCEAGAELIIAPSCTETLRGATRVHVGARARALENQCYVLVSQTVGEAPWSPAVDVNYGYAAAYVTPDVDLPEDGILQTGPVQEACWLYTELDRVKIQQVRKQGQVLNFYGHQELGYTFKDESVEMRTVLC